MTTIKIDSYLQGPLKVSTDTGLDQAMLRAYSIERAVDYGCALEDFLKLRRRVEAGAGWIDVCIQLAEDNITRAQMQERFGLPKNAGNFYLYAAACFRLAQAALEEKPLERLDVYERSVAAFSTALDLLGHADARLTISYAQAQHGAWFFRPADSPDEDMPCVVVWGGADGWCEAFFGSVPAFLEQGLAVCLVELPGQGLARLRHASYLNSNFTQMVSATLDELSLRGVAKERFGVVGHSLGGTLALRAAVADKRIRASCTNGGSIDFSRSLLAYPRVARRIGRMIGDECSETEALDLLERLCLPVLLPDMATPVLCLHGGEDTLVTNQEVKALLALRGEQSTILEYWEEGIHCINNNSIERNCVIANWFSQQLHIRTV